MEYGKSRRTEQRKRQTSRIGSVTTKGRDITVALNIVGPIKLTTIEESIPDETAEDLRANDTSVVEMSEDMNDPNLSSDCRQRRKTFTIALKCLWTLMKISTKKNCPLGACRDTHIYIDSLF